MSPQGGSRPLLSHRSDDPATCLCRLRAGFVTGPAADSARDGPGALHRGARRGRGREPGSGRRRELAYDTRAVSPGTLFFCVRGSSARRARVRADRGGRAARRRSSSSTRSTSTLPQLVVPDVRRAMPAAATLFFGDPTARARRRRRSPARTGRRRPRSCCTRSSRPTGRRPGLLTNIERRVGGEARPTGLNTPEALDLQRLFRQMARRRRPRLRDGGDVDRAGAGPARRDAVRGARVHEPDAGPPRLPRLDGGVLRGEARAVRPGRPRRDQRRRRVRAPARRRASRTRSPSTPTRTRSTGSTLQLRGALQPRERDRRRAGGARARRRRRRDPARDRVGRGVPGRFEPIDEGQPFTVDRRLRAHARLARQRPARRARARRRAARRRLRRRRRPRPHEAAADGARRRRARRPRDPHLRQPALRGARRDRRRGRRRRARRRSSSSSTAAPRSSSRSATRGPATSS